MRKNSLFGVMALLICAGFAPAVHAQKADDGMFPDVPKSHWAYAAVADLKARGILTGYPAEVSAVKPGGVKKTTGKTKPVTRRRGGLKKQTKRLVRKNFGA
jgi:hypothetical protein